MRKSEREITSFQEIVGVVRRCDTIHLGLVDGGEAYVVPLSFGYAVEGDKIALYFHGAKEGRKHHLIANGGRACVEGDICHGFVENGHGGVTCDYESFIGYGEVRPVSGPEAEKGIGLLMEHCGFPQYECTPQAMAITAVYKISLDDIAGKRRFLR